MNARYPEYLLLALAAVAPAGAMAESPQPATTLIVNCTYAEWPTRDEVARNLRNPVVTVGELEPKLPASVSDAEAKEEVRQLQQFIRREGRRECEQGASHVQVDFIAPQGRRVAVTALAGKSS